MAAADEKQVGIGTTRPYYKLHVGGGEGNRGGIGATDITISGIATVGVANSSAGALRVLGISTFQGDIDLLGSAGVSTVGWDASENRLEFKDNASIGFGTGNDLTLWHDGSISYIKDTVGDLRIAGDKITLELEDGTDVKVIDQFGVNITGVTTTNRLLVSGVSTLTSVGSNLIPDTDGNRNIGAATSEWGDLFVDGTAHIDTLDVDETAYVTTKLSVGTGVTAFANGNLAVAGISTINGGLIVGAGATFTGNILPEADGTRDIGASGLEWKDLYIDGTANIDSLAADTAAIGDLTNNRVVIAGSSGELEDDANFTYDGVGLNVGAGSGVTVSNTGNIAAAGIITANGGVKVGAAFTVDANTGNVAISGVTTVGTALSLGENIKAQFGDGGELIVYGSSGATYIKDTSGDLSIMSNTVTLELENSTNILKGNQFGISVVGVTTTARFYSSGVGTFASDLNVLGNLNVTGDITYDEITGRNLNITGITTFGGLVNVDAGITANTAIIEDLTNNRVVIAGSGGEIEDDANFTYDGVGLNIGAGSGVTVSNTGNITAAGIVTANSGVKVGTAVTVSNIGNIAAAGIVTANGGVKVGTAVSIHANGNLGITGIATADRFIGIHTSADGGGIGIGSTTAHVGYGITYIDFKGPGVSTVYSSSVTGITTIYFQGGGSNTGAAGTWQNDGSQGISTAKSVGINTVGVAVTALMGGEKGASSGIGASMQGLYISNGMMVNDNQLNGNHYIGTAFGGIMAGPVTVNGVVTVDGNWAVV